MEAIRKIRAAMGEEQEKEAREKVDHWLEDIQEKRDMVTSLLDKLYQTSDIEKETTALVTGAPADTEAAKYN